MTWQSLLALGVSGGLLPCPSALIVLLAAVAMHRVAYGLLLVTAFSLGLASVLMLIGVAFVYAGRLLEGRSLPLWATRWVPLAGAFVVICAGFFLCAGALGEAGLQPGLWIGDGKAAGLLPVATVLGTGLVFGLKHACEADHVAAVSTIVSERKSVWSSSLVGGLWGVGHTVSLLAAGVAVILLHLRIPEKAALALEFGVAVMLVVLGINAIRTLRSGGTLHIHTHQHCDRTHSHPHFHPGAEEEPGAHHGWRRSARPVVVGMVHGLAGSGALMLLVLSTVPSPALGFAYVGVFGLGSIGGMMVMSALVGLPLQLTTLRFERVNRALRATAAMVSLGVGLSMAYTIGFVDGLFR